MGSHGRLPRTRPGGVPTHRLDGLERHGRPPGDHLQGRSLNRGAAHPLPGAPLRCQHLGLREKWTLRNPVCTYAHPFQAAFVLG
jgi:hypothetical protein